MRSAGEWIHGKYQVERVLGSGGMGTVYATKRRNESRAAVKVLHPRFAMDKTVRARFVEEGYLANRVGHPAVVTILEDDIDEKGNFYLVMEQLDGVDLGKFVGPPRSPVTTAQALNIADQLLSALVQAHQKGIVHRDIKPANLMILRDGRLKLLDFGIAKAIGEGCAGSDLDEDDEELVLGTDRYMSPEQGKGFFDTIDARSDLWSVGALLLALLADEEPSAVPLWDQAYEERAWAFSKLGQNVPPHVVQIISLALQPQKSKRWVSAAAMKEAVHAAHLDLYGPITSEALAKMAATKMEAPLGEPDSQPAPTSEEPLSTPTPVPTDPTAVSRRSRPPQKPLAVETSQEGLPMRRSSPGVALLAVALLVIGAVWLIRKDIGLSSVATSPSSQETSVTPEAALQTEVQAPEAGGNTKSKMVDIEVDPALGSNIQAETSSEETQDGELHHPSPRSAQKPSKQPLTNKAAPNHERQPGMRGPESSGKQGAGEQAVPEREVPSDASTGLPACDGLDGIFAVENCQ